MALRSPPPLPGQPRATIPTLTEASADSAAELSPVAPSSLATVQTWPAHEPTGTHASRLGTATSPGGTEPGARWSGRTHPTSAAKQGNSSSPSAGNDTRLTLKALLNRWLWVR